MPEIPTSLLAPCEDPSNVEVVSNADLLRLLSNILQAYDICKARHLALVKATVPQGE